MTQTDTGGNAYSLYAEGIGCWDGMTLLDSHAQTPFTDEELMLDDSGTRIALYLGIEFSDYQWSIHWPIYVARKRYDLAAAMIAEKRRRESV
jgi:hypothetical protein